MQTGEVPEIPPTHGAAVGLDEEVVKCIHKKYNATTLRSIP